MILCYLSRFVVGIGNVFFVVKTENPDAEGVRQGVWRVQCYNWFRGKTRRE